MLRGSADHNDLPFEPRGIVHDDVDPLIDGGVELLRFTSALVARDDPSVAEARGVLVAAVGEAGAVRAAAVAGNFEMMNRVVDGTGVPVSRDMWAMADDLGVDRPD